MKKIIFLSIFVMTGIDSQAQQNTFPTTGNVGIGTLTPTNKLEVVNGDALINGHTFGRGGGGLNSNIVIGNASLLSNTAGIANVAIGYSSLRNNTTGNYNTANGYQALYSNTSASYNTAVGVFSLYSNTTGTLNTAVGNNTLYLNTTGNFNTAGGYQALYKNSTGSYNTAFGLAAMESNLAGFYNTSIGYASLYLNTTGSENAACGYSSLYKNTTGNFNAAFGGNALYNNVGGVDNTASGYASLFNNTYGNLNTALGKQALYSNNTGSKNTASGYQALYLNDIGYENSAFGYRSLYANKGGIWNVSIGNSALINNTNGNVNCATGYEALYSNTIGTNNTGTGYRALRTVTTGEYNTAIGSYADVLYINLNNATAVGYSASVDNYNKVRIGNTAVTSIGGAVSWSSSSDGRIKKNVKENVPGIEFINLLRPVTYHFDLKKENELIGVNDSSKYEGKYDIEKFQFTGFIAQEVEAAAKNVGYDFSGVDKSGVIMGLRYSEFVAPLVKAVQELSEQNSILKNEIEKLKSNSNNLMSQNNEGAVKLAIAEIQSAMLGQNIPNPFDNSTVIPFRIPKGCKSASILVTDISGKNVISAIPVSCDETHAVIEAGALSSGNYQYTLFIDGKPFESKKMIISK